MTCFCIFRLSNLAFCRNSVFWFYLVNSVCSVSLAVSRGSQFLEGGCWERGGKHFQERGLQLLHKEKLKSEIFNDKKSF